MADIPGGSYLTSCPTCRCTTFLLCQTLRRYFLSVVIDETDGSVHARDLAAEVDWSRARNHLVCTRCFVAVPVATRLLIHTADDERQDP